MTLDPVALRAEFPLLAAVDGPLHYLDSAATSQIHRSALDALVRYETTSRANVLRGNYRLAEAATAAYESARQQAARFLNARSPDEIVFTSGATAALNLVAWSFGERLASGDEVLISQAEHHSNLVPWQRLRERTGIVLKALPLTGEGRIDVGELPRLVGARCRIIAVTHCSNVTGAITDVPAIIAAARSVGALVLLDGAQQVQHGPVDVQSLDIDLYAFSGHKCFGPTGVGVLWGRAEILEDLPPFLCGGGMVGRVDMDGATYAESPRRFEAGTPPIAQAVGLGAALEWMAGLPWEAIHSGELELAGRLLDGLGGLKGIKVIGPTDLAARQPIVSFDLAGLHPHDVCQILDGRGLALRGGHHCAQPLLRASGVEGANRASVALYNTAGDIEALLAGLHDARRILA